MPNVFDSFKFKWEGAEYEVPSDRIFGAIARVEEHVSLGELYAMIDNYRAVKNTQLAAAYSALLGYVGKPTSRESIYAVIFPADSDARVNTINAITGLLQLMIPDKVKKDAVAAAEKQLSSGQEPKNGNRRVRRAAASSSKRRSKRHTVGGSSPKNSGDSTPPSSGG